MRHLIFDRDADSSCEWSARCLTSWKPTTFGYDYELRTIPSRTFPDKSTHQSGLLSTLHVMKCLKNVTGVVSSRLSQVTPFIAIALLNFIKESTSYIHNTVLGISNTTFT